MPNAEINRLRSAITIALQDGNGTMAKRYLEMRGVTRGAGDSIPELVDRIIGHLESGSLAPSVGWDLVREISEFGDKRIYLYHGDGRALRRVEASTFGSRLVASLGVARVAVLPQAPTMNYAYFGDGHVRVSYSETHLRVRANRAVRGYLETPSTCVCVVDADTQSGFVYVALDTPGDEHPHGSTALSYFDHYLRDVAPTILGCTLTPIELHAALHAMDKEKYRKVVRPAVIFGDGKGGMGLRLSNKGRADLRDYDEYADTQNKIKLRKQARVTWLKTGGRVNLDRVSAGDSLMREINTDVQASPAMVRFARHTLSSEAAFVLRTVREIV